MSAQKNSHLRLVTSHRPPSFRRHALRRLLVALLITAPFISLLLWQASRGNYALSHLLPLLLLPLVYFLTELLTGRELAHLGSSWQKLRRWERTIITVAIILIALLLCITVGGTFGRI
ncbi:MAG TPA: hypothetical protein VFR01_05575 [Geobacterales bacterium]|nr:hypothetical protein [Geobacterales bacterium]